MPALHESVTYCRACDWYVAAFEISSCTECGAALCPGCGIETSDPDLLACSPQCRALANRRFREAATPPELANRNDRTRAREAADERTGRTLRVPLAVVRGPNRGAATVQISSSPSIPHTKGTH